jgi:hypothetical protein
MHSDLPAYLILKASPLNQPHLRNDRDGLKPLISRKYNTCYRAGYTGGCRVYWTGTKNCNRDSGEGVPGAIFSQEQPLFSASRVSAFLALKSSDMAYWRCFRMADNLRVAEHPGEVGE